MELQVQHENHTIVLWLRSGCRADLSLLYETPYIGLLFCGDCGNPMFSMSRKGLDPAYTLRHLSPARA